MSQGGVQQRQVAVLRASRGAWRSRGRARANSPLKWPHGCNLFSWMHRHQWRDAGNIAGRVGTPHTTASSLPHHLEDSQSVAGALCAGAWRGVAGVGGVSHG
jgi:hypothetical protein